MQLVSPALLGWGRFVELQLNRTTRTRESRVNSDFVFLRTLSRSEPKLGHAVACRNPVALRLFEGKVWFVITLFSLRLVPVCIGMASIF